jgi:hypothetical protein
LITRDSTAEAIRTIDFARAGVELEGAIRAVNSARICAAGVGAAGAGPGLRRRRRRGRRRAGSARRAEMALAQLGVRVRPRSAADSLAVQVVQAGPPRRRAQALEGGPAGRLVADPQQLGLRVPAEACELVDGLVVHCRRSHRTSHASRQAALGSSGVS